MAISKKDAFSDEDALLASAAKAISHPARIAVLRELAARNTCICGELVDVLPLAQATVSQHLKALREAGLIVGTIDGPRTCYCLDREALARVAGALRALFEALDQPGSCC